MKRAATATLTAAPPVAYETDYAGWLDSQVALIETGRVAKLDLTHIAEELRDLSVRERRELESRMIVLLTHVLKQFIAGPLNPSWRGWELTTREQRRQIAEILGQSPSLKPHFVALESKSYAIAREDAALVLGIVVDVLPETIDQLAARMAPTKIF